MKPAVNPTPLATLIPTEEGALVQARHTSGQLYFRPDTEELVFLDANTAGAFEVHWQGMLRSMDALHQAQADYSSALQRYGQHYSTPGTQPRLLEAGKADIDLAEQAMEAQRKRLQEKLGEFSTQGMRYDDVVELLPVVRRPSTGEKGKKSKALGQRLIYAKKGVYDAFGEGKRLRTVSLKAADTRTGDESIYQADKRGRRRVDLDKLGQQLKAKAPVIKAELKDVPGMAPVLEKLNRNGDLADIFGETLFGWAKSWNESLVHHKEHENDIDTSAGAQFMRYASNVGASAEYDPGQGNVALKAEAAASLVVASGQATVTRYLPNRLGAHVAFKLGNGIVDLGLLRIALDYQASGFVGASLQLEAQLQVITTPNRDGQAITGQPGGRLPRFREQRGTGKAFHQQMSDDDEGLSVSAELFTGVRLQLGMKGSVQWLKPIGPHDRRPAEDRARDKAAEYVEFCSINRQISGLMGKGIGAKFFCKFVNGKFCFHVSASLCGGIGAKGAFEAEVSARNMGEFSVWVAYQLHVANYQPLMFLDHDALGVFTQYSILYVLLGPSLAKAIYETVLDVRKKLDENLTDLVGRTQASVVGKVDAVKGRNQMALDVLAHKDGLLTCTPEAKATLLYLLTRHGKWDCAGHLFKMVTEGAFDKYQDRKQAVIEVFRSVQSLPEWEFILHLYGPVGKDPESERSSKVRESRQEILDFLQIGFDADNEFIEAEKNIQEQHKQALIDRARQRASETLEAWEKRLKPKGSIGFSLSCNDTPYYAFSTGINFAYPAICKFEVYEAEGEGL